MLPADAGWLSIRLMHHVHWRQAICQRLIVVSALPCSHPPIVERTSMTFSGESKGVYSIATTPLLTPTARVEMDYLLSRVARYDKRAAV